MPDLPPPRQPRPGKKKAKRKPKKESNTLFIVAVSLGGVALLGLIVCCGGGYWFFSNAVKVVDTPAEIEAIREDIADMQIPPEFHPEMGMKLSIGFPLSMVAYTSADRIEDGGFLLMQMNPPGNQTEEQMRRQFEIQAESRNPRNEVEIENSEFRELTIDGKKVNFEFVKGKDVERNKEVRQVVGFFKSRNGYAYLMLIMDEADWDEDKVVNFIESITVEQR